MSNEITRLCRFKGNDSRFDKSKTYMVNIKEESRTAGNASSETIKWYVDTQKTRP